MSTVIYLFNQNVQILTGTASKTNTNVTRAISEMAPEGSIINGIVMDAESFSAFLKQLVEEKKLPQKDVTLVIGSTKFIGKSLELPKLNDNQTLDFITREFADMGRDSSSVYSYIKLGNADKMQKIYAESISPDFLSEYISMFEFAGVKLSAIYSGESSLINYISLKIAKDYKTFITILADGMSLITVLWVNGSFYYYNSARSFHERGTPEYAEDISRSISKVDQFMKAHQLEEHLQQVVLAGFRAEYTDLYCNSIRELGLDIPTSVFQIQSDLQFFIPAVSGLYSNGKKENFLPQYLALQKKTDGKSGGISVNLLQKILILAGLLVIMLCATVFLTLVKNGKQKKLDQINEYNESPSVTYGLMDYEFYSSQNVHLQKQVDETKKIRENIKTYPTGNSEVLDIIENCASEYGTITYSAFFAEGGTITMTANGEEVEQINKFIKTLMNQDIFCKVSYTGYTYEETTASWNINVTLLLAEAAGRKEAAK